MATSLSLEKSIPPLPEKVKEDVVSCDCRGNKNISEQVFPASLAGMSKLKMLDIVLETSPKKLVPGADDGLDESIGMMR